MVVQQSAAERPKEVQLERLERATSKKARVGVSGCGLEEVQRSD